MNRIQAPDGSILEFPDSMSDADILGVMRREYGGPKEAAQSSGPIQAAADIGRMVIKGAAMGKEATAADAADRANAFRAVGNKLARRSDPTPQASAADYQPFFDQEKTAAKEAAQRAGWAGTVAEIGGAAAAGGPLFKGIGMLGQAASAVPMAGRVLSSPYATAAATGAILGTSQAAGTDADKLKAALLGAGLGAGGQAVGNAISGAASKIAGAFNQKPVIPTADQIKAAKQAAYDAADNSGVVVKPEFFQDVKTRIEKRLADMAFEPSMQPKIAPVLNRIEKAAAENNTLSGVEVIRKMAGNAYDPTNKTSNSMMGIIKEEIDRAISNPPSGSILMGDAAAGVKALAEARKNAQIGFKLDDIAKAQEIAKLQTAAAGSGGNVDNNTRRKIAQALLMPGKGRNLTPDERAAAEQVVNGTPTQNALRLIGKLSPSGNGLMAALQAGAAGATGGASLPVAAIGMGAKKVADSATTRNVERLSEIIRAGGKNPESLITPNALQRLAKAERERLVRALMATGIIASPSFTQ